MREDVQQSDADRVSVFTHKVAVVVGDSACKVGHLKEWRRVLPRKGNDFRFAERPFCLVKPRQGAAVGYMHFFGQGPE